MAAMKGLPVVTSGLQVPVAIYTRVSTDNQTGGRFDSCESQAAICRESIAKRAGEGWYEVACYTDAAYSGGSMDRPGIRALKRQIEAGEVQVVLIFKLERVLRSTDEWIPFRSFLQKHGCRLESATEDISENTPSGRLKNNLLMSVAEYERLNTAEKTRAKMLQQAKQGIWNGGWLPHGYAYDAKSQMLLPDPVEAPVIRRIFDQVAKFVPLQDLANALNAEGLRTRERLIRRRDGKVDKVGGQLFRSDAIRFIVANPIYRGAIRFGGKEYPARHEPLVSAEIWEKANAVAFDLRVSPRPRRVDRESQSHLLKGLVHCSACQRALIPHESGKKDPKGKPYRYYNCGFVQKQRQAGACAVSRLPADGLEAVVKELVVQLSQHPDVVAAVMETARERRNVDRPTLQKQADAIERELTKVKKHLKNCLDIAAAGGLEMINDSFKERIAALEQERLQLTINLERKRHAIVACEAAMIDHKRVVQALVRLREIIPDLPFPAQRELFRLFVERIDVRRLETKTGAGRRLLELKIKIHLPNLVAGMERQPVGQGYRQRSVPLPILVRGASVAAVADFTDAARGELKIEAPFTQVVRLSGKVAVRNGNKPDKPVKPSALVRALAWQRELLTESLSQSDLARKYGVSKSSVSQYLKLTTLAPEIVAEQVTRPLKSLPNPLSLRELMGLVKMQTKREVFPKQSP